MKKVVGLFLISFVFVLMFSTSTYAYPGGLLDGKTLTLTNPKGTADTTTTLVTDNNTSTYLRVAKKGSLTVPEGIEYSFNSPVTISSFKVYITKPSGGSGVYVYYYDSNNTIIYSKPVTAVGESIIEHLEVQNVAKVSVIGASDNFYTNINEFDVFAKNTEVPAISDLTALGSDSKVSLSWSKVPDAIKYSVQRSTTAGGPYTSITNDVYSSTYDDIKVINGTTYYYVVTAITASGESSYSNEASATPQAPATSKGDRAILTIIMTTGLEKEFDLSMEEVNAFIDWYDTKENGIGPARYGIDKHNNNKGPFSKRVDYVVFKNILSFEVDEYTTE